MQATRMWMAGLGLLGVAATAFAQSRPTVIVDPGQRQVYDVAVQRFADGSPRPADAEKFREELGRALEHSGVFHLLSQRAFLGPDQTDSLVQGELAKDAELLTADFRVWDPSRCTSLVHKRYRQAASADPGLLARRIADDVVGAFLGVRGVSATEIAFVSTRRGNGEIFVMGADGGNQRSATANGSINNFPAWSPDGDAILYTSYRQGKP